MFTSTKSLKVYTAKPYQQLETTSPYCQLIGDLSGYGERFWIQPVDWFDEEEQMCRFSQSHPDLVFEIHSDYEDGSTYIDFYKDGMTYRAQTVVIFPDFDESKLQQI